MGILRDTYDMYLESDEDWGDIVAPLSSSRKGLEDLFSEHDIEIVYYEEYQ